MEPGQGEEVRGAGGAEAGGDLPPQAAAVACQQGAEQRGGLRVGEGNPPEERAQRLRTARRPDLEPLQQHDEQRTSRARRHDSQIPRKFLPRFQSCIPPSEI